MVGGRGPPPVARSRNPHWTKKVAWIVCIGLSLEVSLFWAWTFHTSSSPLGFCKNGLTILPWDDVANAMAVFNLPTSVFSSSNEKDQEWELLESKNDPDQVIPLSSPLTSSKDTSLDTIDFGGVQARAWDPWPKEKPLPCFPSDLNWNRLPHRRNPSHRGFLFMREMKTGSSTAVGVHLRIARNEARRRHLPPASNRTIAICDNRFDHTSAEEYDYANRIREESFLWATVRDPTKRAISQFFHFEVSRSKREPSDANFQSYLSQVLFRQYYIWNLGRKRQYAPLTPIQVANQIIQDYDFIAVTERMDESIVALQMLLGLPMADILYLSAKGAGGFDDGAYEGRCFYIVPSYVSPGMKKFFEGDLWKHRTSGELRLHQAVNRSLDLTIDRLGREEFQRNLAKFRHAQRVVQSRCLSHTALPCDPGGRRMDLGENDCLFFDSGCAFSCLDEVATELDLW